MDNNLIELKCRYHMDLSASTLFLPATSLDSLLRNHIEAGLSDHLSV